MKNKKILKYYNYYIKESDNDDIFSNSKKKFKEIKEEIKKMIKKTTNSTGDDYNSFLKSFLKNPEDVKIEGLINDSDIYEFYLKWKNDIDEILNDENFFEIRPSDMNIYGLYDYIINATKKAVEYIVEMLNQKENI